MRSHVSLGMFFTRVCCFAGLFDLAFVMRKQLSKVTARIV